MYGLIEDTQEVRHMRRIMNFTLGAFCGALVGSVVAIMLAPSSGDELRSTAMDRVKSLQSEMGDAYEARKAQLEAELEALRRRPPEAS
jgi:gas vesicle protein